VRQAVDTVEPDLIVLDPLTRAINGDSNQSAPVAEFFTGVQSLGYPAIVPTRSSSPGCARRFTRHWNVFLMPRD